MITADDVVTNTYKGEVGVCACGCRGTYRPFGTLAAKMRIELLNKNWEQVQTYDTYSDEMVYELNTGKRVTRVYVSRNSRDQGVQR